MSEIVAALNVINAISRQLTGDPNLNKLLVQIIRQTREVLHYDRVHLYLLDKARSTLVLTATCSADGVETKPLEHTIPLDHPTSPTARAVREARCIADDSVGEPDLRTAPFLSYLRSASAAPIVENQAAGSNRDREPDRLFHPGGRAERMGERLATSAGKSGGSGYHA